MSDGAHIPPQDVDAERAVLGGVLQDSKAILDLPAELRPESFYLPTHARIFQTMLDLWQREATGAATDDDRARLQELKVSLDQCWDLLRQRRAREEFGQDPDEASERPTDTVEKYWQ